LNFSPHTPKRKHGTMLIPLAIKPSLCHVDVPTFMRTGKGSAPPPPNSELVCASRPPAHCAWRKLTPAKPAVGLRRAQTNRVTPNLRQSRGGLVVRRGPRPRSSLRRRAEYHPPTDHCQAPFRRRTTQLTCPAGAGSLTDEKPTCPPGQVQRLVRLARRGWSEVTHPSTTRQN
jgi:hypothetical protein